MEYGIIYRFFKLRKFGFIHSQSESIFFHFSELKDQTERKDVVTFDVIKTSKGKKAVNIRRLKNDEFSQNILQEQGQNSLFKWLLIYMDKALYKIEEQKYIEQSSKKEAEKAQEFKINQKKYLELYVEQFSSKEFSDTFEVEIASKFWKDSKDFTEAGFSYYISSKYNITYDFEIPFMSGMLNFQKYDDKIQRKFPDLYIQNLLDYNEFLKYEELDPRRIKPTFTKGEMEKIRVKMKKNSKEILRKFNITYNSAEHLASLQHYLHADYPNSRSHDLDFLFLVESKLDEFLVTYSNDPNIYELSKKEKEEDPEWELRIMSQMFEVRTK